MANLVKGMREWLAYSTMDDDEWDTMRRVRLEEELRRLISARSGCLSEAATGPHPGTVSVPVRSGALRKLRNVPGRVFISRDSYGDGERLKVHLMVPSVSDEGTQSWSPVCAWTFDSLSEVADFVAPPSTGSTGS